MLTGPGGAVVKTSTPTSAWPICLRAPMQPASRELVAPLAAVLNGWGRGGSCRLKPAFQAGGVVIAVEGCAEVGAVLL